MDQKLLVSIIIPVYNVQQYLIRCLDSVVGQTYSNIEPILIDDGSTDGSGEICDEYQKKDSRFKVIHQSNGGVSAARNCGLDNCNGDFIMFIDADDWVENNYVEELLKLALVHTGKCCFCECYIEKEDGTKDVYNKGKRGELSPLQDEFWANIFRFMLWKGIYPKCIIDEIRFEADIYRSEDYLFVFKCVKNCNGFISTNNLLYHYLIREGSACHSGFDDRAYSEIIAWNRILDLFKDAKKALQHGKVYYVQMCWRILKSNYNNAAFRKKYYKSIIREFRQKFNAKYLFCHGSFRSFLVAILKFLFPRVILSIKL